MYMRRQTVSLCVIAMLATAGAARAAEGAHWTYKGHGGPVEWGSMDAAFASCKLGKLQSPIDIVGAKPAKLSPIKFNYQPSPLKIIDNGHTIQVNYAPGSFIVVGGVRYELVQFHFHHPSEEKIDGKAHEMVAHLVHKNAEGKLAVVAVLIDKGGASELVGTLWKNIPHEKEREATVDGVTIDVTQLLPENKDYYTFQGSLTTPPCSEGVTWFVLKAPVKIADAEIAAFAKIYPLNARPVQPLNGRTIETTK
jgi:carbonic anhydrase